MSESLDTEILDIVRSVDPIFYQNQADRVHRFVHKYFDEVVVMGTPSVHTPTLFVPTHRSIYLDGLVLGLTLAQHSVKPPAMIAGRNTFVGPIGNYLKKLKAIPIDKPKKGEKKDFTTLYNTTKVLMGEHENLVVFVEGGRSYNGQILDAKEGVLGAVLQTQDMGIADILVQPVAINYDNTVDTTVFQTLQQMKVNMEEKGKPLSFLRRLYGSVGYIMTDLLCHLRQYGRSNKGNAYLQFGEPFSMAEFTKVSRGGERFKVRRHELGVHLMQTLRKDFPFTSTNIVASAMTSESVLYEDLLTSSSTLQSVLEWQGANMTALGGKTLEQNVQQALGILESRDCVKIDYLSPGNVLNVKKLGEKRMRYHAAPVVQYLEGIF